MKDFILHDLPWLMSAISLFSIYLSGKKVRANWLIGLGNQALWAAFIMTAHTWGMAPLTVGITILCVKNWFAWAPTKETA